VKRRCVFLDRDGVINRAALPGKYIESWDEWILIPSIVDWIRLFNAMGYLVIVVTNQRCIARGLVREETVADIHNRMKVVLAERGAGIDDVFLCPHEENTCDCRKPAVGLVRQAVEKWDVDVDASVLIGDSERDRQLAEAVGMPFIRVADGHIVEVIPEPG
jgi:D-glycero-D-manno-heptose 1,7-bisphosphate phosphatase